MHYETDKISAIDGEELRSRVRSAKPFPHFLIDDFLKPDFAEAVHDGFPTLDSAKEIGRSFAAVNERGKIQVTDSSKFAPPLQALNDTLQSDEWLKLMAYVFDMPDLQADPKLTGGGLHVTGSRGHLDVHLDFNILKDRDLHRRLNILIYLNKDWEESWGGNVELWDKDVKHCEHSFSPIFNRCVVFATNDVSWHGVTAVNCPSDRCRRSYAAYYYSEQPPENWDGKFHSTIFKARPNEKIKGRIQMPLENASRASRRILQNVKKKLKG